VGLSGTELTPEEERYLGDVPPAGVILFSRNVSSPRQLAALTGRIHEIIRGSGALDPLVMADHEGGRISVLSRAIGIPPSQAAVARTGSIRLSRSLYGAIARDLRALGVNALLGPVADVNTEPDNPVIGTRSFGDDPARVAVLVREAVIAVQREKVAACIKHFPGHGSTVDDSHVDLPVIKRTPTRLKELDRPPFGAGIWAGASMVMMGHIVPPEGSGPATYESGIIAGTLREELGFDGVVVTDALEMSGARVRVRELSGESPEERTPAEIVELALQAGNDLLLFSRPIVEVYPMLDGIDPSMELSPGFWEETFPILSAPSSSRVQALRSKFALGREERIRSDGVVRDMPQLAGKIAEKSISVARDPGSHLPLKKGGLGAVRFAGERSDFENTCVLSFIEKVLVICGQGEQVLDGLDDYEALRALLEHSAIESDAMEIDTFRLEPPDDSGGAKILFLLNRRAMGGELLAKLAEEADVIIVTDWPYAADILPVESTVIVTYGTYPAAAEALFEVSHASS
jgi:beta-glucosidase-like glycosyl hydrolase